MIYGQNVFDQPVKNNLITYDNIRNIAIGLGGDYMTGCLLGYTYYRMIAIDLSKQQALDVDPKTIQQFYCKFRSSRKHNNIFHCWTSKRNNFKFFTKNCECVSHFYFVLI